MKDKEREREKSLDKFSFFSFCLFILFFPFFFFSLYPFFKQQQKKKRVMQSINMAGGTTVIALSLLASLSYYYLYNDKRFTLSERLYFLICKRNIKEALLEHELLQKGIIFSPPVLF